MKGEEMLEDHARELAPSPAEEADLLLRLRKLPPPPGRSAWRAPSLLAVPLLALAGLLLWAASPPGSAPGLRGVGPVEGAFPEDAGPAEVRPIPPPELSVELRLALARGGAATPLQAGGVLAVGDAVIFSVSATQEAELRVWVEGPGGEEPIARLAVQAGEPETLTLGEGLLSWRFEEPGSYTFVAAAQGGCGGPGCDRVEVLVR